MENTPSIQPNQIANILRLLSFVFLGTGLYCFLAPETLQNLFEIDADTARIIAGCLMAVGAADYAVAFLLDKKKTPL